VVSEGIIVFVVSYPPAAKIASAADDWTTSAAADDSPPEVFQGHIEAVEEVHPSTPADIPPPDFVVVAPSAIVVYGEREDIKGSKKDVGYTAECC
jgi:hypothetical protein